MKSQSQVLAEYLGASTPGHWLLAEVADYLFGDPDDLDALEDVIERLDEERPSFASTHLDPAAVSEFTVEVLQRSEVALASRYQSIPSPMLLLDLCLRVAEPGDVVNITHRYGSGLECVFESRWPFGMDWAVRATTCMPQQRDELAAEAGDWPATAGIPFNAGRLRSWAGSLAARLARAARAFRA